jgi:hypothetical protein
MKKAIIFDMDGTIVDLYGVDGWLQDLIAEDTRPYNIAKPLINMSILARTLNRLKHNGWEIDIVTWGSKESSEDFFQQTVMAKKKWLKRHLPSVCLDKIIVTKYGVPKHSVANGILFDDNAIVRHQWTGLAYDEKDIIGVLSHLK